MAGLLASAAASVVMPVGRCTGHMQRSMNVSWPIDGDAWHVRYTSVLVNLILVGLCVCGVCPVHLHLVSCTPLEADLRSSSALDIDFSQGFLLGTCPL